VYLGSHRKNEAVAGLLGLPTVEEVFSFKDASDNS